MPAAIDANRFACELPTMRTVEVEQFCSWSACKMRSTSSALTSSGDTLYGSVGNPNIMRMKFST